MELTSWPGRAKLKHVSFGLSVCSERSQLPNSEEGDDLLNCINDFRHSLQSKDLIALDKEAEKRNACFFFPGSCCMQDELCPIS